MGAYHHQRRPRPRYGYHQQRALRWPPGLEPVELCQGPRHRAAPVETEPFRQVGRDPGAGPAHRRRRALAGGAVTPGWTGRASSRLSRADPERRTREAAGADAVLGPDAVRGLWRRLFQDRRPPFRLFDGPQQGTDGLHQPAHRAAGQAGGDRAGRLERASNGPALFEVFATEFTTEWNRLQAAGSSARDGLEAKRARLAVQLERLVDALADGKHVAGTISRRIHALEVEQAQVICNLANTATSATRLHPNLPRLYRQRVAELTAALSGAGSAVAVNAVRALVDAITLTPIDGTLEIGLRGEIAAIFELGCGQISRRLGDDGAVLVRQVKTVAGTGFEPVTFRL